MTSRRAQRRDRVIIAGDGIIAQALGNAYDTIRFEDTTEKGKEGIDRVQILECESIFVVDDDNVRRLIKKQLAALERIHELEGQQQLAGTAADEDQDPDQED